MFIIFPERHFCNFPTWHQHISVLFPHKASTTLKDIMQSTEQMWSSVVTQHSVQVPHDIPQSNSQDCHYIILYQYLSDSILVPRHPMLCHSGLHAWALGIPTAVACGNGQGWTDNVGMDKMHVGMDKMDKDNAQNHYQTTLRLVHIYFSCYWLKSIGFLEAKVLRCYF